MVNSIDKYFSACFNKYILQRRTLYVLGAGCAVGCVPLWKDILSGLIRRIDEYLIEIPECEIAGERKEPIIKFLREYAKKADSKIISSYTLNKLDSIKRRVIDLLYICELLSGWKFLCQNPNQNPYKVFKYTPPLNPIINYNQDHLISLLQIPNKIYEPHGSIFKILKPLFPLDPFIDANLLEGTSLAADIFQIINEQEALLIREAIYEANSLVNDSKYLASPLNENFIIPGDSESVIFSKDYEDNIQDILSAYIDYTFLPKGLTNLENSMRSIYNRYGSDIYKEVQKISNEDCHADAWMEILNSLCYARQIVVIGFSFAPYDNAILKLLKFLHNKPHIILLDPYAINILKMIKHELRTDKVASEIFDWSEFTEYVDYFNQQ